MKVPIFEKKTFVDMATGNLTPSAQNDFDVMIQQMQINLSDDGLVVPSLTTGQINNIASSSNDNAKPNGTMWYDETTNQMKAKINGVVKIFTLT